MLAGSSVRVLRFVARAVLCAFAALSISPAQVDWHAMPDLPPRADASTCEHPTGTGLIRFGGTSSTDRHDDTMIWDGSTWRWLATQGPPSARSGAAMARNPLTNRVLLFGGLGYAPNGLVLYLGDADGDGDLEAWQGSVSHLRWHKGEAAMSADRCR